MEIVAAIGWVSTAMASCLVADEPLRPGRLSKEEQAALQPGLVLRWFDEESGQRTRDAVRVSIAAIHIPAETNPTVRLSAGRYSFRLTGYLRVALRSEATFLLEGNGETELHVNGKRVARRENDELTYAAGETTSLVKGYNQIEIRSTPPAKGPLTMRVLWRGEDFGLEPLPPEQLFSRGDAADLEEAGRVRQGRELFAERHCARCHTRPGEEVSAASAMPDLMHEGPSLAGAGDRFRSEWLVAWMLDPAALVPSATMPRVFSRDDKGASGKALDIAAYLHSLRRVDVAKEPAAGDEKEGEILFENLGCIACHHWNGPEVNDAHGRRSLKFAPAKYTAASLQEFLKAPMLHYPWRKMPDFRLTATEVQHLSAYFVAKGESSLPAGAAAPEISAGDVARGGELFVAMGCANCHAVGGERTKPLAKRSAPSATSLRGCLAAEDGARGTAPYFGFAAKDRESLGSALAEPECFGRETAAEFSRRQAAALRCTACHDRHGRLPDLPSILAEEGSQGTTPEKFPSLTWIGEKLRPEWSALMLGGKLDHKPREWLKARMPSFGVRAELLSLGLSHEHGLAADDNFAPKADATLGAIGAKLIEKEGGFNCIMCHAVGDRPAVAPFEAPGVPLAAVSTRLRYRYAARWLLDPTRVDPGTKMPKFSLDGKTTGIVDELEGSAPRQFDAVWHFLETLAPRKN